MKKSFLLAAIAALCLSPVAFAEQSCCSDHGGINSCQLSTSTLLCTDGYSEPKCVCNAKTNINQQHLKPISSDKKHKGAVSPPSKKKTAKTKSSVKKKSTKKTPAKKNAATKKKSTIKTKKNKNGSLAMTHSIGH